MKLKSTLRSPKFLFVSCLCIVLSFSSSVEGQATITGRVFNDVNNNLAFQPGEGLANIKVWLFDLNGVAPYYRVAPLMSTTTDASGVYTFTGLANSDYQVRVGMTTMPSTITRAVVDNDSYPNGLTDLAGVTGTNTYSNINFGFATTATPPSFSSARNFQWNAANTFNGQLTKTFNLAQETCGGTTYTPTITWSTDRINTPGTGYGTDVYPQAYSSTNSLGQNFPGTSKGGIHPGDNTFQLMFGGASYNPVNNDRQTTTIQFSRPVVNTKFSIYDIDHADPQSFSGRIDYVKVTGYRSGVVVLPVIVNPSATPWNTVSGNTVTGWADYTLTSYNPSYNSADEDHGTVNVYFENAVDKIVIDYEEWAPVMLPGKGINNAATPNAAYSETSWSDRAPTTRGIAIGSVDYTSECLVVLPVQLSSFNAETKACNTLLNWKMTSESDLNYFEVEYAADAANFKSIGKVSRKNSSAGNDYTFTAPQTNTAIAYYRLKMIDNDGKYQYSDIRSVKNTCSAALINWTLAPNPVKRGSAFSVNLSASGNATKKASIVCWDSYGRKSTEKNLELNTGINSYTFNTDLLTPGIYLVGVYDGDNKLSGTLQKIVVQ